MSLKYKLITKALVNKKILNNFNDLISDYIYTVAII